MRTYLDRRGYVQTDGCSPYGVDFLSLDTLLSFTHLCKLPVYKVTVERGLVFGFVLVLVYRGDWTVAPALLRRVR